MADAAGSATDDPVTFKYVFIPSDSGEDIQERTFETVKSDEVMSFINHLKRHFRRSGGPSSDAQRAAAREAFKAHIGDKATGVGDGLLDALSSTQMVEPIALLANSPANGFVGVYMYADDQASIKGLPHNARATAIAQAAGLHLQVSGDVFIGRYMDNEEDFERLDFPISDLSSSAPWVEAAQEQLRRRDARSGQTRALLQKLQGQGRDAQADNSSSAAAANGGSSSNSGNSSPGDIQKAMGNAAFARGDWASAVEHYSAALKLDTSNTAARNNRAMAYLKLCLWKEAAADATDVLEREPHNVKALLRRAAAAEAQGAPAAAVTDLRTVLQLQPANAEAVSRLAVLEQQQQQAGTAGSCGSCCSDAAACGGAAAPV